MSDTRNRHLLPPRTCIAAAGSWLFAPRTAAATVSSCFGATLSGIAMPIEDPGGGPGG